MSAKHGVPRDLIDILYTDGGFPLHQQLFCININIAEYIFLF